MIRNAVQAARVTLAAIPLYAQSLAGMAGVNVIFSATANTAKTDGVNVILPRIPLPRTDDDVEAAQLLDVLMTGFVAHECGHVRNTDFSVETESEQVHKFVNAIEDPRQEAATIREFPGLRSILDAMLEKLIGVPGFYTVLTADQAPIWLLSAYTMYSLRADLRDQPRFGELAVNSRPALVATFGEGFVSRLDVICAISGPKLRSTADSHAMAKDILKAMEEEEQKQNEQQGQQEQSDESNSGEASSGDGQPSQDGQAGGQQGDANEGQEGNEAGDGDGESGSEGGEQTDAQQGDGGQQGSSKQDGSQKGGNGAGGNADDQATDDGTSSGPSAAEIASALKDAREDAENGLKDVGDLVAKSIGEAIAELSDKGIDGYIADSAEADIDPQAPTASRPTPNGKFDASQAMLYTGQLRNAMQNELKALQRRRDHESIRGTTLNQKTLHRTSTGDRRLFLKVDDRKELNTAIMILLDVSTSMAGERIKLAQQASFAIATALNGLRGVSTAVATFPAYEVLLRFGEMATRQPEYFATGVVGTTPMAEAVLWAGRQLARRREDRKVLMVITDGQPNNAPSALAQIKAVEHHGIETMGIGIQLPTIGKLFEKHGVIKSIDELTPTMMSMIRGTLRSQLMAA